MNRRGFFALIGAAVVGRKLAPEPPRAIRSMIPFASKVGTGGLFNPKADIHTEYFGTYDGPLKVPFRFHNAALAPKAGHGSLFNPKAHIHTLYVATYGAPIRLHRNGFVLQSVSDVSWQAIRA